VRLECASFRNEVGKGFDEIVIAHAVGNAARTAQLLVDKGARGGDGVRRRSTGRSITVVHLEENDEGVMGLGWAISAGWAVANWADFKW
jgi:hypothetical protein